MPASHRGATCAGARQFVDDFSHQHVVLTEIKLVPDPDLLLDSWREEYDLKKNRIIKGHIAVRSSNEIIQKISEHIMVLYQKN